MTYYFTKTLNLPFDDAVRRTKAVLKEFGFGVITEIDLRATFKSKLDVDFRPYTILGACNPAMAHAALELESRIGVMLPCNVVLQERAPGQVEVAAIDPVASMAAVDNDLLKGVAGNVRERIRLAVEAL